LVYWSNLEQLTSQIDYYLSPEAIEKRQLIANNGNQLCESKYTWKYRIESQLLPLINL
jgi:hypothetical protein